MDVLVAEVEVEAFLEQTVVSAQQQDAVVVAAPEEVEEEVVEPSVGVASVEQPEAVVLQSSQEDQPSAVAVGVLPDEEGAEVASVLEDAMVP